MTLASCAHHFGSGTRAARVASTRHKEGKVNSESVSEFIIVYMTEYTSKHRGSKYRLVETAKKILGSY